MDGTVPCYGRVVAIHLGSRLKQYSCPTCHFTPTHLKHCSARVSCRGGGGVPMQALFISNRQLTLDPDHEASAFSGTNPVSPLYDQASYSQRMLRSVCVDLCAHVCAHAQASPGQRGLHRRPSRPPGGGHSSVRTTAGRAPLRAVGKAKGNDPATHTNGRTHKHKKETSAAAANQETATAPCAPLPFAGGDHGDINKRPSLCCAALFHPRFASL